jgi:hypothetical protein
MKDRVMTIPFVLLWPLTSLVVACSSGWSNNDETFTKAYTEVLIVREQYPDTLKANPRVQKILQQHGFTEQTFTEQYQHYARDPNEFRRLIDSTRARLKAIGEQEQQRRNKHPQGQDQKQIR